MWFLLFFHRLKSQEGAFLIAKAGSGGAGIRKLIPIRMPVDGYSVQQLKDEAKSSTLYVVPLNTDIDETPITVNDISTVSNNEIFSLCVNCNLKIPLFGFKEHKSECYGKSMYIHKKSAKI